MLEYYLHYLEITVNGYKKRLRKIAENPQDIAFDMCLQPLRIIFEKVMWKNPGNAKQQIRVDAFPAEQFINIGTVTA